MLFFPQLSAMIFWPVIMATSLRNTVDVWTVPVALLLISVRWWETYFKRSKNDKTITREDLNVLSGLSKVKYWFKFTKYRVRKSRAKIYVAVSLWKCGVTILVAMLIQKDRTFADFFNFDINSRCTGRISTSDIPRLNLDWVWVALINILVGFVVYSCARSAAKIQMQKISYAVPLMLNTPLTFGLLIGLCEIWHNNSCAFARGIPGYISFNCYSKIGEVFSSNHLWIFVFWWASQLWITRHIWYPFAGRLSATDKYECFSNSKQNI